MRWLRVGLAGAVCALVVLVGACAAPPTPPGTATPSGTALPSTSTGADALLEIVQLRGDVATGHIELRVTNEGSEPLAIQRATYASSRWSEAMVRDDEAHIPPGARRNLRLQLPEPTCHDAPLEHRATLVLADGSVLEEAPADPLGQLEALDDAVCDLRAFEREVASIRWLDPAIPADGSGPAVLRLEVAPVPGAGTAAGRVDEIAATVLLAPLDASGARIEALPIRLAVTAGAPPSVVEVPLTPGRCDLHAVAEDKQGTLFRIRATRGGAPVDLLLASPDAQRDALLGWVVARCAALG